MRASTIVFLIILTTLFGCRYFEKKKSPYIKGFSGVVVAKDRKDIANFNYQMNDSLLIGKWSLEVNWSAIKGAWGGCKPLEYSKEFIFTKNRKFYETEFNEKSIVNWTRRGEFFVTKEKNRIEFAFNEKMDTVFALGDTAHVIRKRVHLLNDSILRIEEFHYLFDENYNDIEEYKRVK